MTTFDPRRAEHVHFATDDRIGSLAEAMYRLRHGEWAAAAWRTMPRDDQHPLRREARDWIRAAVAAGILPLTDEAQHWADHGCHRAGCPECAAAKYMAGMGNSVPAQRDGEQAEATPLAVAFGGAMAAPNFAAGNLVNISDPGHKRYGQRGSVIGYVYDPLGVVVEYDNFGNTVTVRPDQLMHHDAFVEQESRAEFAAKVAATAWSATDQFEHNQACEAAIDAADAERWAAEDGGEF